MFYADYAVPNNTTRPGGYDLLYTCAQEICSQRQGHVSFMQHNALIDLAHAHMVMTTAAAWSALLGVDADWRARWTEVASGLSAFPETLDDANLPSGPDGRPLTGNRSVWSEAWDVVGPDPSPINCLPWNCSCQAFTDYFDSHASKDWGCCTYRQSRWWVQHHCNVPQSPGAAHGGCPVPLINCSLAGQCLNGGTCVNEKGWNFGVCMCPDAWGGRRCEKAMPPPPPPANRTMTPAQFASNYMYPIIHFAPIHPCNAVGLYSDVYSDNDTEAHTVLLAKAVNTVWGDNERSGWHPVNGLCLAWPSATRITDGAKPGHTAALLDRYESALNDTMQPNFWPSMSGGGLEQVGATVAVNELLLQSHEGFITFFPAWGIGLAAKFTTLRTRGAFLVSASISASGVVGNVTLYSEAGAPCTFKSPWASTPVVASLTGTVVPISATTTRGVALWRFVTSRNTTYVLHAPVPT